MNNHQINTFRDVIDFIHEQYYTHLELNFEKVAESTIAELILEFHPVNSVSDTFHLDMQKGDNDDWRKFGRDIAKNNPAAKTSIRFRWNEPFREFPGLASVSAAFFSGIVKMCQLQQVMLICPGNQRYLESFPLQEMASDGCTLHSFCILGWFNISADCGEYMASVIKKIHVKVIKLDTFCGPRSDGFATLLEGCKHSKANAVFISDCCAYTNTSIGIDFKPLLHDDPQSPSSIRHVTLHTRLKSGRFIKQVKDFVQELPYNHSIKVMVVYSPFELEDIVKSGIHHEVAKSLYNIYCMDTLINHSNHTLQKFLVTCKRRTYDSAIFDLTRPNDVVAPSMIHQILKCNRKENSKDLRILEKASLALSDARPTIDITRSLALKSGREHLRRIGMLTGYCKVTEHQLKKGGKLATATLQRLRRSLAPVWHNISLEVNATATASMLPRMLSWKPRGVNMCDNAVGSRQMLSFMFDILRNSDKTWAQRK